MILPLLLALAAHADPTVPTYGPPTLAEVCAELDDAADAAEARAAELDALAHDCVMERPEDPDCEFYMDMRDGLRSAAATFRRTMILYHCP